MLQWLAKMLIVWLDLEVFEAISKLNPGKSDGNVGLGTDNFRHTCPELSVHISSFLSGVLAHGTVPVELQIYIMLLISKGRNLDVM